MKSEPIKDLSPDKMMWIEIRAGLLGFRKAIEYSNYLGPGGGIALAALGRIVKAIEMRWGLGEPEKYKILPKVDID